MPLVQRLGHTRPSLTVLWPGSKLFAVKAARIKQSPVHCFVQRSARCTERLTGTFLAHHGAFIASGASRQLRRRRYGGKAAPDCTATFREFASPRPFIVRVAPYGVSCSSSGRRPSSRTRRFSLSRVGNEAVRDLPPLGKVMTAILGRPRRRIALKHKRSCYQLRLLISTFPSGMAGSGPVGDPRLSQCAGLP